MFIILTYDVAVPRTTKVLKVCRKYLQHVQKSVFEGMITQAKLQRLQLELESLIHSDTDRICIYEMDSIKYTRKLQIGVYEQTDNFL